jgi:ABC-type sugar transport system permease subunit
MSRISSTPRAAGRSPRTTGRSGHGKVALPLVAPAMVLTALFFFVPMALSLVWSFTKYNGLVPATWVGATNYTHLAQDPAFRAAIRNTAVYALVTMAIGPALGLGTALLLNRGVRAQGFFRSVFFLPVTLSLVVVGTMWKVLLADNGFINQCLALVGVQGPSWLNDPSTALLSVSVASVWAGFGFETVIFLAALQSVPRDLYEAAALDGAGRYRTFRAVTLPSLRPTVVFVYVVGIIGALQVYDQMYVMTRGGPLKSTTTIVYYLMERFQRFDLGTASAAAYVLVIALALLSALQLKLSRRDS